MNAQMPTTVVETNLALVQDAYAAFFRGDLPALLAPTEDGVEWETIGPRSEFPLFGLRRGKAEVEAWFKLLAATMDFTEFQPREFCPSGDRVFVLGHYAMVMKKTGRRMACDWVHVFKIRDGKLVGFREHTDTSAFLAAYRG